MLTRDVILDVDNLRLVGRLYLPKMIGVRTWPVVGVCHGIPAGRPDPSDRGYDELAEDICGEGWGVFVFNFRGCGVSEGNLDMLGWTRDLRAVIDYLYSLPEIDKSRLSLLGFSGGAAVSIVVAAEDTRVSLVVACACPSEFTFFRGSDPLPLIEHFRSIGAIRDKNFPASPQEWLANFMALNPVKYVDKIVPRPLLLIQGNCDETVEVSHVYRLYAQAKEPKQLAIIENGSHRLRQNETAMGLVRDWLKRHYETPS